MIFIITGDINSGKSSYLLSLFNKNKTGDGFYNRKIFMDKTYIGQEIVHLNSGNTTPFSYHLDYIPEDWDELFSYRDYSFSCSGLQFCREIVKNSLTNSQPFYIDEIGPIELQEQGLFQDLQELLQTKKDIYIVIRSGCLSEVLAKFNIDQYIVLASKVVNDH